jgi:3',5'-cyclic AMP phosphodiesterase CpdA
LFSVPGNHDVGNEAAPELLAIYRERFGPDYYTFRIGDIAGFVVDSSLLKAPAKVMDDAAKMETWLKTELAKAKTDGVKHLIVFQHIPPFVKDPAEPEVYDNLSLETRARYLKLLHEYGVKHLFAGHLHTTAEARDGDLEVHISGAVGQPLRGGKSGLRIVNVKADTLTHKYHDFGELPETLLPAPAPAAATPKK